MVLVLRTRLTLVWAFLIAATALSWVLGVESGSGGRTAISVVVIAIALFKVRLIGLWFMELRVAPRVLRGLFEIWCGVVCVALIAVYLAA